MIKIINGREIAKDIRSEIEIEILNLKNRNIIPGLAVILVGDDPASNTYVRMKQKMCAELGIRTKDARPNLNISQEELHALIEEYNSDNEIHGILVQLPLPDQIDENLALSKVLPEKDVDGFHPANVGKVTLGEGGYVPATPAGIIEILLRSGNDPAGKNIVIIGRSRIVGRPLLNLLTQKRKGGNATVTMCHTSTKDLSFHTSKSDIIIVAAGAKNILDASMIKEGVVIIDVGTNRVEDSSKKSGYKLIGDVNFDSVAEKASAITPVPGGVGPLTIIMLMKNCVIAAGGSFK
ncbi:MAG: bifunctional 5,10-methylene-tetrahydrofolate dehydrogenase/5,10-methylene-tetrahydrofolate cyclohydrolase [Candidatus Marinimicrobia bacterium]|nr:bifunctional 5,10-methylene-tetrahydrofolate dehydrogenase/5,10-methylene-tetrahydrofolate cyclohydrolase [Candidatus Neomarinimicrobiota bacterium]